MDCGEVLTDDDDRMDWSEVDDVALDSDDDAQEQPSDVDDDA